MSNEKIIEISNLTKRYGKLTAVDSLNLNVYKGDIFGFLGPNGAGKSTTIRMLLTLIAPTSGTIKIFNQDLRKNRNEILRRIGAIVEKPDFYLYLTAYKNLEILGRMSGIDATKKELMSILALVGLENRFNSKVKTFSHGMKQRLGIAQALLHNPELIILDEPTVGLDPQGIKEVRELILQLSTEKNITIFLSSHILKEIEVVANRMVIIDKGKTVVEGNVNDLINSGNQNVEITYKSGSDISKLLSNSNFNEFEYNITVDKLQINLPDYKIPELISYLCEIQVDVYTVQKKNTLEDFFLQITKNSKQ